MDLEDLLKQLHAQVAEASSVTSPAPLLLEQLRAESGENTAALLVAACSALVADDASKALSSADEARETTFRHIGALEQSDDSGGDHAITLRYRCAWLGAYSLSSIVWAEARMRAADADAIAARSALRAIDLALLRGGAQWNAVARQTIESASRAAAAAREPTAEDSKRAAKRVRVDTASSEHAARRAHELQTPLWVRGEAAANVSRIARLSGGAAEGVSSSVLSLESFRDDYMASFTPLVITGAMARWPALDARSGRMWANMDYLRRLAGERLVPVELCAASDRTQTYLSTSWSQEVMRLADFIDECVASGSVAGAAAGGGGGAGGEGGGAHVGESAGAARIGYLGQHQLFDQIPSLRADIATPSFCAALLPGDSAQRGAANATRLNAWFGPAGTVSPLHYDPFHNLLCQVVGYKCVRVLPYSYRRLCFPVRFLLRFSCLCLPLSLSFSFSCLTSHIAHAQVRVLGRRSTLEANVSPPTAKAQQFVRGPRRGTPGQGRDIWRREGTYWRNARRRGRRSRCDAQSVARL